MALRNAFELIATEAKQDTGNASLSSIDGKQTTGNASLASIDSKTPASATTVPDNTAPGVPTRAIGEDITTCSFADVGSSLLTPDMVGMAIGTGVGVSQSGGNLLITTGTSANAEYLARSVVSWKGSWIAKVKTVLSQRIANQNFAVLMADLIGETLACTINSATSITVTKVAHGFQAKHVGQSMMIGGIVGAAGVPGRYAIASIPSVDTINFTVAGWPASGSCTVDLFGHSYVRNLYSGTTATSSLFDTQRKGWANGDTTATINTTASPGHVFQMHNDGRQVYGLDYLVTSTTTPNATLRSTKFENIPDDNLSLYLFLWSYNGTTAPASTTTWTVGFFSVEKFANQGLYLNGVRPQGTQAPLPVAFPSAQAVSGTVTANIGTGSLAAGTNLIGDVGGQVRATAGGIALNTRLLSAAASTNSTLVKGSAGRVYKIQGYNAAAAVRWLKLYNKATAPTVGTDTPVITLALKPSDVFSIDIGANIGYYFATGIGFGLTTGSADADTGALTAGDVLGLNVFYA